MLKTRISRIYWYLALVEHIYTFGTTIMTSSLSIQAFLQKEPGSTESTIADHPPPSSGFTEAEAIANPLSREWKPTEEYEPVAIGNIFQGKGNIRFSGRVVQFRASEMKKGTTTYSYPHHYIVVKDNTGGIAVSMKGTVQN